MPEWLAEFFLFFTNEPGIITVVLLGYFFCERRFLVAALSLMLFTTVYNLCLKNFWQVPLPPSLHKAGYAFPSGHMHNAVVFYGMLACGLPRYRWLPLLVLSVLWTGVGIALVSKGYHYPGDVVAAFGFGVISIVGTYRLLQTRVVSRRLWVLPLSYLLLAMCLYLCFLRGGHEQGYLFQSMAVLAGVTVGCIPLRCLGSH